MQISLCVLRPKFLPRARGMMPAAAHGQEKVVGGRRERWPRNVPWYFAEGEGLNNALNLADEGLDSRGEIAGYGRLKTAL